MKRREGRRCAYCHALQEAFDFPFEVEHILPITAGGTDETENLAMACRSCNAFKGTRIQAQGPETTETIRLFNPRLQEWDDHFSVNVVTLEIVANTASGRVTIELLQMNSPLQRLARQQWARLSLFP